MSKSSALLAKLLIGDNPKIASLPSAYTQLSKLLEQPTSSVSQVAKAVGTDPALTIQLLRLANSAVYGGRSIHTINQAISRLGFARMRELALASTVVRMFRFMPEHLLNMELFWRHSVATGLCAQILGKHHLGLSTESLFVAGLLHDIGSLLICTQEPKIARNLLIQTQNSGELLHHAERRILGTDHADIGAELLARWKVPKGHQIGVGFHHRPMEAPTQVKIACVVHLADIIVSGLSFGSNGEQLVPNLDERAIKMLGVTPSMLLKVIDELNAGYEEVTAALVPKTKVA
ncbi:MAG: HDOD domain-containing protein [Rhodobacterales bacterium]|nr:HDOD domain-containing protein [Rhodobacterales bacterium]